MFKDILGCVYDRTIRPYLPRRLSVYNGIAVPSKYKLFDLGYRPSIKSYELPLCDGIRRTVQKNDSITIIGGGKGVSGLIAAEHAYPNGEVTIYEASEEQCEEIRSTISYYPTESLVSVFHISVGEINNPYGELGEPESLLPENLPESDILIIDAEGAESDIVPNLDYSPRALIVETHGCFDSPTHSVHRELKRQGYETNLVGYESVRKDVAVLVAKFS